MVLSALFLVALAACYPPRRFNHGILVWNALLNNNKNCATNFNLYLCVCVFVSVHSCPDNLCTRLMAALQAKTKLSSNEPGVCPPDLRGAATANKTHKDSRPWHWPSPRLSAILPLPHTAAYCFVSGPRRGSSSHLLFQGSPATRVPLLHRHSWMGTHTHTNRKTCKVTHFSR